MLWAEFGWLVRDYRSEIGDKLKELFDTFLSNTDHPPWALQAGVALFVFFGGALVVYPDLLNWMQTLRAGDMEAKFATSSNRIPTSN